MSYERLLKAGFISILEVIALYIYIVNHKHINSYGIIGLILCSIVLFPILPLVFLELTNKEKAISKRILNSILFIIIPILLMLSIWASAVLSAPKIR
jgi:hypothetical protein